MAKNGSWYLHGVCLARVWAYSLRNRILWPAWPNLPAGRNPVILRNPAISPDTLLYRDWSKYQWEVKILEALKVEIGLIKKFLAVATSEDDEAVVSTCSQISVLSRHIVANNGAKREKLPDETNLWLWLVIQRSKCGIEKYIPLFVLVNYKLRVFSWDRHRPPAKMILL